MSTEAFKRSESPKVKANFLSKMFIHWINGLMYKGYKQPLKVEDLYTTVKDETLKHNTDNLEKEWNKELGKKKPSLLKALTRVYIWKIILNTLIVFSFELIRFFQPILISELMNYFDNKIEIKWAAIYSVLFCLSMLYVTTTRHPQFLHVQVMGMKIRLGCIGLIYKKLLKTSLISSNAGQIMNLLSNDANNLDLSVTFAPYLIVAPLQIIAALYILVSTIGWRILTGLVFVVLSVTFSSILGKFYPKLKMKISSLTDNRVQLISEILGSIKIVKFNCWEKLFEKSINEKRKAELNAIKEDAVVLSINQSLLYDLTYWTVFVSISVLLLNLTHDPLLPTYVIYSISYYSRISSSTGIFVGRSMQLLFASLASVKRVQNFLLEKDKVINENNKTFENPFIEAKEFSCGYCQDLHGFSLRNLNFKIQSNQLIAVIGSVGSGKSTLLMALLNEIPFVKGDLEVNGKIFYVCQEPWIFDGSVLENILFGMSYDKEKFDKITKLCCLEQDFKMLENGEHTHIGEKGTNLSGGQRARISMARALYSDAQVYLFDDPLSALDANVGKTIYENCIVNYLKSTIRILVTNQTYLISNADKIMVLKKGDMVDFCNHEKLIESNDSYILDLGIRKAYDEIENDSQINNIQNNLNNDSIDNKNNDSNKELINFRGSISWSTYIGYFRAGGGIVGIIAILVLFGGTQGLLVFSDYWLSNWATHENQTQFNDSSNYNYTYSNRDYNFHVYIGLMCGSVLLIILRAIVYFAISINSSSNMHRKMFKHVLHSNLRFFHLNPLGRIINRFSQDIGNIDNLLPKTMFEFLQLFMIICGSIIFAAVLNYWVLIPLVPLIVLFYFARRFYLVTAREVKRLEAICRSPLFVHVNSTIQGLTTIRAANTENIMLKEFEDHQDLHTSAYSIYLSINRWFGIRLDCLLLVYSWVLVLSSVFARDSIGLTSGTAGLVLVQLIQMGENFQWCIRQSCEVENLMTSFERVIEYCSLKMENLYESKIGTHSTWPEYGEIKFEDVSFSYDPENEKLPNTLKNLTFTINRKEKIGTVGRTGAGKSSLLMALFRTAEPTGKIIVDGVNIQEISLHKLRNSIATIPQEPVLFSGTLRTNLDPFNTKADFELWNVLEEVQLKEYVKELEGGLDAPIIKGGSNFSLGQKQLLCLARAILTNSKILIVDEATANVDLNTDKLVQNVIRKYFKDCTVLTIAHRLNTIIDNDRIMCLEKGQLINFDTPKNLLEDDTSIFYDLVHKLSKSEIEHLTACAQKVEIQT